MLFRGVLDRCQSGERGCTRAWVDEMLQNETKRDERIYHNCQVEAIKMSDEACVLSKKVVRRQAVNGARKAAQHDPSGLEVGSPKRHRSEHPQPSRPGRGKREAVHSHSLTDGRWCISLGAAECLRQVEEGGACWLTGRASG